jgi:formamidopyrimidine-DNA glycosylase
MPELPEVETCRRGLEPHVLHQPITRVTIRESRLRWPIPANLNKLLKNKVFTSLSRRGKYLLFTTTEGQTVILHLGMSGRVRIVPTATPLQKHDHADIEFAHGVCLRYNDSRRFGCLLWTDLPPQAHPLLAHLGPEPLTEAFNSTYLLTQLARRAQAIKLAIMDSHIVVGVGNIYANEALFQAKIHPQRPANSLSKIELNRLIRCIKTVLDIAIAAGGTTLRDFISAEGKPGYFQQKLLVYGRGEQPCYRCKNPLQESRLGQRTTVFCNTCQH